MSVAQKLFTVTVSLGLSAGLITLAFNNYNEECTCVNPKLQSDIQAIAKDLSALASAFSAQLAQTKQQISQTSPDKQCRQNGDIESLFSEYKRDVDSLLQRYEEQLKTLKIQHTVSSAHPPLQSLPPPQVPKNSAKNQHNVNPPANTRQAKLPPVPPPVADQNPPPPDIPRPPDMPPPDTPPQKGAELGYTGKPLPLSKANLIQTGQRIIPRFLKRVKNIEWVSKGVWYSEGIALCSAGVLAEVDVILESGTAGGQSAELMAKFFSGTHVKLYTIDNGSNEAASQFLGSAAKRLKGYSNIQMIRADSFKMFPEIINKHKGKRIGAFVDGPKGKGGLKLCMLAFATSKDVKYCAVHDISIGHAMSKEILRWDRALLVTYQGEWKQHFEHLDAPIPAYEKEKAYEFNKMHGHGVAILAGFEAKPLGLSGDTEAKVR